MAAYANNYDPLIYTDYRKAHWEWVERDEPLLVKKVPKVDAPLHTKGKFLMFEGESRGTVASTKRNSSDRAAR